MLLVVLHLYGHLLLILLIFCCRVDFGPDLTDSAFPTFEKLLEELFELLTLVVAIAFTPRGFVPAAVVSPEPTPPATFAIDVFRLLSRKACASAAILSSRRSSALENFSMTFVDVDVVGVS